MPDGSIIISCQPELLKVTLNSDYPDGIYHDGILGEYVLKTQAMDACMASVGDASPMLLVQRSTVGRNNFYTIFICAGSKRNIFQPDVTIYHEIQALADTTSNTMWQQRRLTWNLGPLYSITDLVMMDTMFLSALLAIAQQEQSYTVYSPVAPGILNLWVACFQAQTQNWQNPSKSYLYTFTDAVLGYVLC